MKSSSDQRQEFNTTLLVTVALAALLASGFLGLVYGCMEANQASGREPRAEVQYSALSS